MKLILLIFSLLLTFSCKTTKQTTETAKITRMTGKDFELVKAYKQRWYGGRPNVKGTYYKVVLKRNSEAKITFDSMFVKNKWCKAFLEDKNPYVVMATITDPMPRDNMSLKPKNIEETEVDEAIKDKNILTYQINGKKAYIEIGDFTEEVSLSYP